MLIGRLECVNLYMRPDTFRKGKNKFLNVVDLAIIYLLCEFSFFFLFQKKSEKSTYKRTLVISNNLNRVLFVKVLAAHLLTSYTCYYTRLKHSQNNSLSKLQNISQPEISHQLDIHRVTQYPNPLPRASSKPIPAYNITLSPLSAI